MQNQRKYVFYIISCLCLSIAVFSGIYVYRSAMMKWFLQLPSSRITPSGGVLAALWSTSFAVTFSAYLLIREEKDHLLYELGETLYLGMLLLCLMWPICFFYFKSPIAGMADMIFIMLTAFVTSSVFFKITNGTMWLMICYIVIMTFIFHTNLFIIVKSYGLIN